MKAEMYVWRERVVGRLRKYDGLSRPSEAAGGRPGKAVLLIARCMVAITAILLAKSLLFPSSAACASEPDSFGLLDSREQGVLNIGKSWAEMSHVSEPSLDKEVLRLDYSIPKGTVAGVWTKGYPAELTSDAVEIVRVGINLPEPNQASQIALKVEIKGTAGIQLIPLELRPGWNDFQDSVDWDRIGDLAEVVFVLDQAGDTDPAAGSVFFDLSFQALPQVPTISTSVMERIGGVFLTSLLLALLVAVLSRLVGREANRGARSPMIATTRLGNLTRDFAYGAAAVLVAGMAIGIYSLGTTTDLETGWWCVVVGIVGALMAELLKLVLTGKHLTPGEAFRDMFFTGLFAGTASGMQIWQAPESWTGLMQLSGFGAATFCVMYHLASAYRLSTASRHLSTIGGILLAGTPYVFGLALLLQSGEFLGSLGRAITFNALTDWPATMEGIGRVAALFAFNVAVVNALSLMAGRRVVSCIKTYALLLVFAAAAITAPVIADFGSGKTVASMPGVIRLVAVLLTTMLSQAPLWAEVYLITGLLTDAMRGKGPSIDTAFKYPLDGMRKGAIYAGTLMAILQGLNLLVHSSVCQSLYGVAPVILWMLAGALAYPLVKTIIESFEGSQAFFRRAKASYRNPMLYVRGCVIGLGAAIVLSRDFFSLPMSERVWTGFGIGILAYAGVSIIRDVGNASRGCGRLQSWRVYFVEACLGGFVGAGLGFYMDTAQVPVVQQKFALYNSAGLDSVAYDCYPLVNKWGRIQLGDYTGGVKLLFNEALLGVIAWAIAAWLFAINRAFMAAFFQREMAPIKRLLSKEGFAELIEHMIFVLRWGLWMSPIIMTFLRKMAVPTWYNQDGAIRTIVATFNNLTMETEDFSSWSLEIFTCLLAYGVVRVLIWIDHMGLRVATLVNLSFLGMDKLDERVSRFLGRYATARFIPEGVKRFTTWAPLLIPFYIPAGADWDHAWEKSEAIQRASAEGGWLATLQSLSPLQMLLVGLGAIASATLASFVIRSLSEKFSRRRESACRLNNSRYEVVLKQSGEFNSTLIHKGYDISRRAYDGIDPAGRAFFLVDASQDPKGRAWPIIGNYPTELFVKSEIAQDDASLIVTNVSNGVKTTVDISLPGRADAVELWDVTIENLTDEKRQLKLVPYLEWVLNEPGADRTHTQYNRLFPEVGYEARLNAILALHRSTKAVGFLAAQKPPEGFLSSRIDFIGRAGNVWMPRVLETLAFSEAPDTDTHPTFDPIGSLLLGFDIEPGGIGTVRFMIGCAEDEKRACKLVEHYLAPQAAKSVAAATQKTKTPLIGHGEILPGTPQPYYEFRDNGNKLGVLTPYTPRPYDHSMSNALGHVMCVTNRGLHTTASGNSQQNRVTPDWADTVTRELPGEAFYLYDTEAREWYSPTYQPLNDADAKYDVEFGVDGTATFRMAKDTISTELTTYVPPDDPTGVYLLTVKNDGDTPRRLRFAPYFQIVLADNPEHSGPLKVNHDKTTSALFFENPRNTFRSGPAFAAISLPAERVETKRGRFLGKGRAVAHPFMVESGKPDHANTDDDRPIASFLTTLQIPAGGERTVAVILGQADDRKRAEAVVRKYRDVGTALARLDDTRTWWSSLMSTLRIETNDPDFDGYQNWLKYQTLAERIWARRGFYQSSGAFGFRDQLQDTVNMIWVDPNLARNQLLLHAAQQFLEGDVVHWFFRLQDGRTGFACRSHAYDNLLWLGWGVVEYLRMTGDDSILDESVSYLRAETPLEPLPKGKDGMGFFPLRSSTEESVYHHCLRAFDLVLERRMGANGLPLIGAGDWNDGLDEIGSEGRGESVWLGFFLYYILAQFVDVVERKEGSARKEHYLNIMEQLKGALERTWREDRYLRAIHDDGTEIGVKDSGIWEIDALTAAWAVMSGINPERGRIVFDTAIRTLERDNVVLLGWPALREDSKPYLGRSSRYPEGVRENGMYCHGVQWLIKASRILAERFERDGDHDQADRYRETCYRLGLKISPIAHMAPDEVEIYGGQPNKQAADMLTTFDPGRMIWNGYTGAAGWMLRQACEGVVGANLVNSEVIPPDDLDKPRGKLKVTRVHRSVGESPFGTTSPAETSSIRR